MISLMNNSPQFIKSKVKKKCSLNNLIDSFKQDDSRAMYGNEVLVSRIKVNETWFIDQEAVSE